MAIGSIIGDAIADHKHRFRNTFGTDGYSNGITFRGSAGEDGFGGSGFNAVSGKTSAMAYGQASIDSVIGEYYFYETRPVSISAYLCIKY
jgi:hypothetical protein